MDGGVMCIAGDGLGWVCDRPVHVQYLSLCEGHDRHRRIGQTYRPIRRYHPGVKVGEQWNFWTVIGEAGRNASGNRVFRCQCQCGAQRVVSSSDLVNGHSKSCGACGIRRLGEWDDDIDRLGGKTCNRCGQFKLLDNFSTGGGARGLACECKDCQRDRHHLRRYGITTAEWADLMESQLGRCYICGGTEPGGPGYWHTDHAHDDVCGHSVGAVGCHLCIRGIACFDCNTKKIPGLELVPDSKWVDELLSRRPLRKEGDEF